jgi:hypothetical protein
MSCKDENKIFNPKTKRCVKKDGKVGKTLNKKKSASPQRSPKSPHLCSKDKIFNPKTKRCVKKDGKIGKTLIEVSDKTKNLLKTKYGITIPQGYYLSKLLGVGQSGTVYIICKTVNNDCGRAIKIQHNSDGFNKEVKMHKTFENLGLAPRLYESQNQGKKTYIVSERFDGTFENVLKVKQDKKVLDDMFDYIKDSYYIMKKNNLIHGDLHWGNVAYKEENKKIKYFLNDFGYSTKMKTKVDEINLMELLQLYRTIGLIENKYNKVYMKEKVEKFILEETGFDVLKYDFKEVVKYFDKLHPQYQIKYL